VAKQSDKRRERRISATEASRSFSHVLDEVEKGQRFLVERYGRDICVIASPSGSRRRASECLTILRARPRVLLDNGFGADLLKVIREEPAENRPQWDS